MSKQKTPRTLTKSDARFESIVLPDLQETPGDRSLYVMPTVGLKPDHWYVVEVSYGPNNPVFKSLLFTGFCGEKGMAPGSYAGVVNPSGDPEWASWSNRMNRPYYMRVAKDLGELLLIPCLAERQAMEATDPTDEEN